MAGIDVDRLLTEVSADSPCGPDLEYDAAFREMEQAAQGKPEQRMGATVIPGEEPNWKDVREKALDVLQRSRDLRAAMHLARALVHMEGFPGLASALAVVRGLFEKFWDGFHPALDPEEGLDPTMRLNILMTLCSPTSLLGSVRAAPLLDVRGIGRFSLRDIQWSKGEAPPPEGTKPADPGIIKGAVMKCDVESLKAGEAAARACIEHSQVVEDFLTAKLGAAQSVSLDPFRDVMKQIRNTFAEYLKLRGVAGVAGPDEVATGGAGPNAPPPPPGSITTREDAMRMLDTIADWFAANEPSSPVPLLLRRARRLVSKSFIEILKDMAPDGLPQAEKIGGVDSTGG